MSSTTIAAEPGIVVALERAARDVIRARVASDLEALDYRALIDDVEKPTAQRARRQIEALFAVLDQLGWQAADPRETFELVMDDHLSGYLRVALEADAEMITYERRCLARLRAGDLDYCAIGRGVTESTEIVVRQIKDLQQRVRVLGRVLADAVGPIRPVAVDA